VLGIVRILTFDSPTFVVYLPCFDVEIKLVDRLVVLECTRPKLGVVRKDVYSSYGVGLPAGSSRSHSTHLFTVESAILLR